VGRVDQLHVQPGGLQQVVPDPLVVAYALHDRQLRPVGVSRAASVRIAAAIAGTSSSRDARRAAQSRGRDVAEA
jgi:hypothetical protein